MKAIAAHFRYITKNGRLQIEDDRGVVERGKESLLDIERQWRFGGAYIDDKGYRREAFNVMLSMPRGTDPQAVLAAAREFAKIEFDDHRYVMVLHDHQANPHVHLSVKAESKHGQRLNPRKADLYRWRERFAEQLRERGIDAEATRQVTRGRYPHARRPLASEGQGGGEAAPLAAQANRRYSGPTWSRRGAGGLDKDRACLGEFCGPRGPCPGDRDRWLCAGRSDQASARAETHGPVADKAARDRTNAGESSNHRWP